MWIQYTPCFVLLQPVYQRVPDFQKEKSDRAFVLSGQQPKLPDRDGLALLRAHGLMSAFDARLRTLALDEEGGV